MTTDYGQFEWWERELKKARMELAIVQQELVKARAKADRLSRALVTIASSGDDIANDGAIHAECCRIARKALKGEQG